MKKWIVIIALIAISFTVISSARSAAAQDGALQKKTPTAESKSLYNTGISWNEGVRFADETIKSLSKKKEPWIKVPVYAANDILRDEDSVIVLTRDRSNERYRNNSGARLYSLLERFNTDAIRLKEDGTVYFAYDTDTGYRLFIYALEDTGKYYKQTGYTIVYGDSHCYQDFAGLKTGDPIEMVELIDSAATVYKEYVSDFWGYSPEAIKVAVKKALPPVSIHYLTDGLLFITYGVSEENEIVISKIDYYKDYVMPDCWGREINYRILDCDLLK